MMTIQPHAIAASVAGTQRAVTRSGDAQDSNAQSVNRQGRAENPGGQQGGVEQVEKDAAMGDSGADGRQLLDDRHASHDDAQEPDDTDHAARHRVSKEGTGGRIDFDA